MFVSVDCIKMASVNLKWLQRKYPRNYLIENPWAGALINAIFCFLFLLLYKPLGTHASRSFSYAATMAVYSSSTAAALLFFVWMINLFRWFSDVKEWTILKELTSILIIMAGIGTVIYLMGFLMEAPDDRLNIGTFLNSVFSSFLLSLIPFTFFSAVNYRYLLTGSDDYGENYSESSFGKDSGPEPLIHITSKLKKEELSFYPGQLIYAESDGNYVVFHLERDGTMSREIIRNSISNTEQQLASFPYFLRTHRAFIVNLKKIKSKHGNVLSYQLKLSGCDSMIPVSRSNIETFDRVFAKLHH